MGGEPYTHMQALQGGDYSHIDHVKSHKVILIDREGDV